MTVLFKDQAENLRRITTVKKPGIVPGFRSVVFAGGAPGVGTTTIAANIALALNKLGKRAAVLDLSTKGGACTLLNISPVHNLPDLSDGDPKPNQIFLENPQGLKVIPAHLTKAIFCGIAPAQWKRLNDNLKHLDPDVDALIIDMSARPLHNVPAVIDNSDTVVLVATPDPEAVTGAYSIFKRSVGTSTPGSVRMVLNKTLGKNCLLRTGEKIRNVFKKYSGYDINAVVQVESDALVIEAARRRLPALISFPESLFSKKISALALNLFNDSPASISAGCISEYFSKTVRLKAE